MLDLMRKYVYTFVNSHNFDVPQDIMTADYTLHMGTDTLIGRDEHYLPAVKHQFAQFPNLGYTIHEMLSADDHTAVLFSEHGASRREPNQLAAWTGVAIYRAEHDRLAECWVEQDHFGRRHQLATGVPYQLAPSAIDPWSAHQPAQLGEQDALTRWVTELQQWPPPGADLDSGQAATPQPQIDIDSVAVNAAVAEYGQVAFNLTIRGTYTGGFPDRTSAIGCSVATYVGAFATVNEGRLEHVRGVSNRVAVQRQLKDADK